jgi:hypothetical protein
MFIHLKQVLDIAKDELQLDGAVVKGLSGYSRSDML